MAKRKTKNPPFQSAEAGYSLFINEQAFGPKGIDPGSTEPELARIDTEEALEYGQLAAIHVDLRFCEHLCERMLLRRRDLKAIKSFQDAHLSLIDEVRISMIASNVAYARCFGSGKRLRLDYRDIWREGDAARDAHLYFKNVRDKFVAHSVNDFEDVAVALTYVVGDDRPTILKLTDAFATSVIPNEYLIKWLRRLSKQAQKHIENRMDQLRARILKQGKGLGAEELAAMPRLSVKAGAFNDPGRARPK